MIPTDSLWKDMPDEHLRALEDIDSEYPDGLDFTPGSELHDTIVTKLVMECALRGKESNDEPVRQYQKIDDQLDCYMSPDELDRRRQGKDSRKPVNVVIPQQFANLDIFKTGMHKAFFSGRYIHRYAGKGSPQRAAKAVIANELILRIGQWFRHRRSLDIAYNDCFSYGRAWMWGKWSKEYAPKYEITQIDNTMSMILGDMGVDYSPGDVVRTMSDEVEITKEGTKWVNLSPYQVFTDPNTTPDNFQDSEFFGWATRTDALLMVGYENDPEEQMFNCKGLPIIAETSPRSACYREDEPEEKRLDVTRDRSHTQRSSTVDIVYLMCRIIPRDWNLGDGKTPQLWFFAVAGDKLLIKAHQIRSRHGQYPVVCAAPNARGHQIAPVSHLMVTQGISGAIDYLVKRRMDFLDTAHNGKFVIDTTKLEYKDFKDSDGGPTVIRMKKSAFGSGRISDWFEQLPVNDVTSGTWADVASLMQMSKDGSGIQEILLGGGSALPERPTATGIDALQGAALSRLARSAIVIDEQMHAPKGYQDLCNASQYMDSEVIIDIEGKDEEIVREWYALPEGASGLSVSRWDIDPEMDVVPMSNVSQGAKSFSAMTEVVKSIMPAYLAQPGAVQALQPMISQYMREMGIDDYDYINMSFAPMEQIQQQAMAGNLQPTGMAQGGVAA